MLVAHPLAKISSNFPLVSGCYFFKDKAGVIIYVGKAKNLRERTGNYFSGIYSQNSKNQNNNDHKTRQLLEEAISLEYQETATEIEALLLENSLIKRWRPKFNIRLKDDKTYPYLKINFSHPFPKLEIVRKIQKKKSDCVYFGPFVYTLQFYKAVEILTKFLGIRSCSDQELSSRKRPCLLYQLKQCTAPCVALISQENYLERVKFLKDFFSGRPSAIFSFLEEEMKNFSEKEEFEMAAMIRDNLQSLTGFLAYQEEIQQLLPSLDKKSVDFISCLKGEEEIYWAIAIIRSGIFYGIRHFSFPIEFLHKEETQEQLLEFLPSQLLEYYQREKLLGISLPEEIIWGGENFSEKFSNEELLFSISSWEQLLGFSVKIGKSKGSFQESFIQKIQDSLWEKRSQKEKTRGIFSMACQLLKQLLQLKAAPVLLECVDIAVFQGSSPAASRVVHGKNGLRKDLYRYYKLEERPEKNNDVAMMREFFLRYLQGEEYLSYSKNFSKRVLIVDGGTPQVSIAFRCLEECGLKDSLLSIVGIAKARKIFKTSERLVFARKNSFGKMVFEEVSLEKYPELMRILCHLRDEAHRFSRKLHHRLEKKRLLKR